MTTAALPAPLVPSEVDLRDFAFMPLDVVRLRDSDLSAMEAPDACWAAVLLWCASWHQVPAASVPNDDRVLANLAGFGRVVREWQKVREGALRGWVACSDGRLYHPVVAEKARDAWRSKLDQRWKTECARIKKHNQRHGLSLPLPDFDAWLSFGCPWGQPLPVPGDTGGKSQGTSPPCPPPVPRETHSKGQGEGQGQGQGIEKKENPPAARVPPTASPRAAKRCPPGFEVDEAMRQWARTEFPAVDVSLETATFRDHTFATARSDWPATWRNWIRRKGAQLVSSPPQRQTAADRRIATIEGLTGRSTRHERPPDQADFIDVAARVVR